MIWFPNRRRKYVLATVAMAIGTFALLSVPYVFKVSLDLLAAGKADLTSVLIPAALIIIGLNCLHGFFTYLRGKVDSRSK